MTKKHLFSIMIFVLFSLQIQAQSSFAIKITQVYPSGGVVYGNTYNLSSELDKAEASLRSQYTGKEANYEMELTRPSGRETKTIQNINWILMANTKTIPCKNKPTFNTLYPEATTVKIYACNNNGSKKGSEEVKEYYYYHQYFKNDVLQPMSKEYRAKEECIAAAQKYFKDNRPKVDSVLFEVRVFDKDDISIAGIEGVSNKKEYEQFKKEQAAAIAQPTAKPKSPCQDTLAYYDGKLNEMQRIVPQLKKPAKDSLLQQQERLKNEAFTIMMNDCIAIDSVYSQENIKETLSLCKDALKYLTEDKPSEESKGNFKIIAEKIIKITDILVKNGKKPENFDKYKLLKTKKISELSARITRLNNTNEKK
ncbi:MAG: hypothetical protein FWG84_01450 [Bacteroidales bacterium]|nr:hypothetical protein [Bacteroidales bacterium]